MADFKVTSINVINDGTVSGSMTIFDSLTVPSVTGSLTKLTDGSDYLVTDGTIELTTGSNGSVTLAVNQDIIPDFTAGNGLQLNNEEFSIDDSVVATISGSTFIGPVIFEAGLSGSLTKLVDGSDYMVAGSNIEIATGSNGSIVVSAIDTDTVYTAGNGLQLNDEEFSIDDSVVATLSGSTFSGPVVFESGLSGSLTKLVDGSDYIVAGSNIEIATGSNGSITISSLAGGGGDFTAGNGLQLDDEEFSIDDSVVATLSGSTFSGPVVFEAGLSGSLTKLIDGSDYIRAADFIVVTTGSDGSIEIKLDDVTLGDLANVSDSGPSDQDVLAYDLFADRWEPLTLSSVAYSNDHATLDNIEWVSSSHSSPITSSIAGFGLSSEPTVYELGQNLEIIGDELKTVGHFEFTQKETSPATPNTLWVHNGTELDAGTLEWKGLTFISGAIDLANGSSIGVAPDDLTRIRSVSGDIQVSFDGGAYVTLSTVSNVSDLGDVDTSGASTGDILVYDGSGWLPEELKADVEGPGSSSDEHFVIWDGTTGKLIKDSSLLHFSGDSLGNDYVGIRVIDSPTDVSLIIEPKGEGAIMANVPDGTTVGGDARGIYSVDLQRVRTAANEVASGNRSGVLSGRRNRASGNDAVSIGGEGCRATGNWSSALGVLNSTASGTASTAIGTQAAASALRTIVLGGVQNTASAVTAATIGGEYAVADLIGMVAHASGRFSVAGDAQYSRLVLRRQTTNDTTTNLTLNGDAETSSNRFNISNNTHYTFDIHVIAVQTNTGGGGSAGDSKWWHIKGGIKKAGTSASTALIGTTSTVFDGDSSTTDLTVAVTPDTTNGALSIAVTGETSKTIRWVATAHLTKVMR